LTTDANGSHNVLDVVKGRAVDLDDRVSVRYCRRMMLQSTSPELALVLNSHVQWADIVHITAVYSFPVIPAFAAARWNDKPVVWSPRGAVDRRVGRKNWLKPVWDRACMAVAPRRVAFHVTSDEEMEQTARLFPGKLFGVIPNGVEVPAEFASRQRPVNGCLNLLHIGRYDPKKAIENLLEACAELDTKHRHLQWTLRLAGREEGPYARKIRTLVDMLGLRHRVEFMGEVTGPDREVLFGWADVLVLPSNTENFGMVVAEALARGVPVIASRRTPWRHLETNDCGLWVDNTPEKLAAAIRRISAMPLTAMGLNGRRWMTASYSWTSIARRMTDFYQLLRRPEHGGKRSLRVDQRNRGGITPVSAAGSS
jgi:glycosyltransferase involved in cell wall biosynthesis